MSIQPRSLAAKIAGFLALAAVAAAIRYGPEALRRNPAERGTLSFGAGLPAVPAGSAAEGRGAAAAAYPFVPYTDAGLQDRSGGLSEQTPGAVLVSVGTAAFLVSGAGVYSRSESAAGKWLPLYQFPLPDKSLFAKYRPADDVETFRTEIGTVTAGAGRIWAGYKFYGGEGCDGLGGIAYYDPATGAAGVLRHPALVGCAVDGLYIEEGRLAARTYRQGEYTTYVCSGVVELDLKTLKAWAYLPKEGEIVRDHDPAPGEKMLGDKYFVPIAQVLAGDPAFEKKELAAWSADERARLLVEGLDAYMQRTAREETAAAN